MKELIINLVVVALRAFKMFSDVLGAGADKLMNEVDDILGKALDRL